MRRAGLLPVLALAAGIPALSDESVETRPSDTREAAIVRGSIVFRTYCVLCHGTEGKGDGRAARLFTPPPADLTVSPFNDQYKEMIVRGGGAAMGRSPYMPPWGDELSNEQIHDVVAYLRELRKTGK